MPASTNFFGSDTSCITDVALIDQQVTSPLLLIGQRILRRWQTPRGALASINDDPDFGYDVTQLVNAKLTPNAIATAESQLRAEALKDEQVRACTVRVVQSGTTVSVSAAFDTLAGPFALTMNVRDLTVEAVFSFGEQ